MKQPNRRRRIPRWIVTLGALVLGVIVGVLLHDEVGGHMATLEVEARISAGGVLRIYRNSDWAGPLDQKISPGQWTTYRFAVPSRLDNLRIDPSDVEGAEMLIRFIRLRAPGDVVQYIPLAALLGWPRVHLNISGPDAEGLLHLSTLPLGGYIVGSTELDVTRHNIPILSRFRLNSEGFLCACLGGGLFLILALQRWRGWRFWAVAATICAATGATYAAARWMQLRLRPMPSVAETAGYIGFSAYSKQGEMEALNLGLAAGTLLAAAAAAWIFRKPRVGVKWPGGWRRRDWLFLAACFGIFVLASVPPASSFYRSALETAHATDYDSQNVFYWEYAVDRGEMPYRDFWYPYSGMYDEAAPLSPYIAYAWVARLLVFAVTALSLYVCVRRSWMASIAIWAALVLMDSGHLFWPGAVWRYLLAASLALLACAAMQEHSRWMAAGLGCGRFM